jgi:hypothetical protein
VGEIVREKIFLQYRQEIPYACQVNVISYKSRPTAKDFIQVEILVEKESQRSIILGKVKKIVKQYLCAPEYFRILWLRNQLSLIFFKLTLSIAKENTITWGAYLGRMKQFHEIILFALL